MRAAVLLSGGKDSVLAAHIAADWGWDLVRAIVVHPQDPESMLYHVPNVAVAEIQAQRMGLELARVEAPPEAEWEALVPAFGGVDTVVTGAIASEYQRVRVERAAHEAGVMTHNPIWHKPPMWVLEMTLAMGMDVRFSRVAAMGLDESWLGAKLDFHRLQRLSELRLHPAGEGGEYETLVLDAPLFSAPIEVEARPLWERDRGTWIVDRAG